MVLLRLRSSCVRWCIQRLSTDQRSLSDQRLSSDQRSSIDQRSLEWSSNRVRRTFIDYFTALGYTFIQSSSIVPYEDHSLLYVNAGMNQFKPIFLGTLNPSAKRAQLRLAVNSQRCVRVGGRDKDLEQVGRDGYHHTFFEMLGMWFQWNKMLVLVSELHILYNASRLTSVIFYFRQLVIQWTLTEKGCLSPGTPTAH